MPPLDGTFPFAQMDDIALRIGEDLKLDVTGIGQVFLDVDIADAEGVQGDRLRGFERLWQFPFIRRNRSSRSLPRLREGLMITG